MSKGFKLIIVLSMSIILCAGLMVACAEKTPADETAVQTDGANIQNLPTQGDVTDTPEQTEADDADQQPTEGTAPNQVKVEGNTTPETAGGNEPDNGSQGSTASQENTAAPDSEPVGENRPTTATEPAETAAPTTGGNVTEIVVPITPGTTVPGTTESNQPGGTTTPPAGSGDGGTGGSLGITYEQYMSMSGAEQMAYFESFASIEDYFAWYNAAKAEYDSQNPAIEIEGGSIDLGELIGGNR